MLEIIMNLFVQSRFFFKNNVLLFYLRREYQSCDSQFIKNEKRN